MGRKGREFVLKNYGFDTYSEQWYKIINDVIEECGSWENRKNYKHWSFEEL